MKTFILTAMIAISAAAGVIAAAQSAAAGPYQRTSCCGGRYGR